MISRKNLYLYGAALLLTFTFAQAGQAKSATLGVDSGGDTVRGQVITGSSAIDSIRASYKAPELGAAFLPIAVSLSLIAGLIAIRAEKRRFMQK